MTLKIDDDILYKYGLNQKEFFLLAVSKFIYEHDEIEKLLNKDLIAETIKPNVRANQYYLTNKGSGIIRTIIDESDRLEKKEQNSLNELASKMAELFPKGRKDNTTKYWRGNSGLVRQKLKVFFRKYGKFSDEIILEATKKYIDSFGNDLTLMRILPYFIEKNNESELLTTIENINEVVPNNEDWVHTMV